MTDGPELTGCTGYSLEGREGRIGSIAAVLPRRGRDQPGLLIVHSRAPSCGLSAVSVDQVDTVDVEERRIVLRAEPETVQEGKRPPTSTPASSPDLATTRTP